MKKLVLFAITSMFLVACQTKGEPKPFEYATLPDKAEWTVKLYKPLEVVRQESQPNEMPAPVWTAFPLPEFQEGGRLQPLVRPGVPFYGYGMDSGGCVPEALLKTNGIEYGHGWGIAAGQYAYYLRVEVEDHLLYDPRQYAFLISYTSAYLEVTFPDLQSMHVRRLEAPDMSTVKHYGPSDDWQCRFANLD